MQRSCFELPLARSTAAVVTNVIVFGCVIATSLSAMPGTVLGDDAKVALIRTPNEGLQPQVAIDSTGVLHLIYFRGKPGTQYITSILCVASASFSSCH